MPVEEDLIDGMLGEEVRKSIVHPTEIDGVPAFGSEEWQGYALSLLNADELDDKGNPKTAGLRRIFNSLFTCIRSGPVKTVVPDTSEGSRAVVVYQLVYLNKNGLKVYIKEVGEASADNTDDPYSLFLMSVAATRAEGRALRKALLISKVVAEELSQKANIGELPRDDGPISSTQINAIDIQCKKLNINVIKFIAPGKLNRLEDATKKEGKLMLKSLSLYQSGEKVISDKIKTYDPSWRQSA